jgi:hypothetical protein
MNHAFDDPASALRERPSGAPYDDSVTALPPA